ncbi:MAG: RrF2 family transcriptional regulator [Lachnospiraceae bacterium]|nr:RrF2 family transcriptional regulator [Lachnospiraceae bacterium]
MMISTRGRYALRVMIDLAEHTGGEYVPLKDVADRQNISRKYLESIMTVLSKNDMVEGQHGKGGGYRLIRQPEDYRVGDILRLTENSLAPVSCLEEGANPCERAAECKTLPMWSRLFHMINDYFDGITIADLAGGDSADNYVI